MKNPPHYLRYDDDDIDDDEVVIITTVIIINIMIIIAVVVFSLPFFRFNKHKKNKNFIDPRCSFQTELAIYPFYRRLRY